MKKKWLGKIILRAARRLNFLVFDLLSKNINQKFLRLQREKSVKTACRSVFHNSDKVQRYDFDVAVFLHG